jgi:hypothetical protein
VKPLFARTRARGDRSLVCARVLGSASFFIFVYHDFAKIYDMPEILQNYAYVVVVHGVRDVTPWPTAVGAARSGPLVWDRHSAVPHGVRGLATWATTLCPSAVGHGSSKPTSVVGHDARSGCLYNTEIQPKMS